LHRAAFGSFIEDAAVNPHLTYGRNFIGSLQIGRDRP